MEPSQSRAFEVGWEHFTQKSIVPGIKDHCLVEVQHVIVRIRGAVVHNKWQDNESARRFIFQNMLVQRGGQHIIESLDRGIEGSMRDGEHLGWIPCMGQL